MTENKSIFKWIIVYMNMSLVNMKKYLQMYSSTFNINISLSGFPLPELNQTIIPADEAFETHCTSIFKFGNSLNRFSTNITTETHNSKLKI